MPFAWPSKKKSRPQQSSTKLAIDQHLPADFYQESYSNVGWAVPIPPIPPILRFKLQNARRFSVLFHSGRDLIQILHLFIRLLTNVSIGLGEKTLCLLQPKNLPPPWKDVSSLGILRKDTSLVRCGWPFSCTLKQKQELKSIHHSETVFNLSSSFLWVYFYPGKGNKWYFWSIRYPDPCWISRGVQ